MSRYFYTGGRNTKRIMDDGFRCEYDNKTLYIHLGDNDTICIDNIYTDTGVIARLQWDTTGVLQMTHFDGKQWTLVADYNANYSHSYES